MSARVAQQVSNAIRERGQIIILRTTQPQGDQGPVPPIVTAPVTAAALAEGANTLAIDAGSATGWLVPGDCLTIAGQKVVVVTGAGSRPLEAGITPGWDGIVVAPALTAAVAAGVPVEFAFKADTPVKAMVNSFSFRLVDGVNVVAGDLMVTIGAYRQSKPDPTTQKLIVQGDIRTIIAVNPAYGERGEIVKWVMQAQ